MNLLPNELIVYIVGFVDRSTRISCRLVSSEWNKLLPRNNSGENLFIEQVCIDGNEDLFFFAVELGQPLDLLFMQIDIVRNEMMVVIDFLLEEKVLSVDRILSHAIDADKEVVFSKYFYTGYKTTDCKRLWVNKYIDDSLFSAKENKRRMVIAYRDGNIPVVEKLLAEGYAIPNSSIMAHYDTVLWQFKRGKLLDAECVVHKDVVEYFYETGQSVVPYLREAIIDTSFKCFNLALQQLGITDRVTGHSERQDYVALMIKHKISTDYLALLNELFSILDIESLKLLQPIHGKANDDIEIVEGCLNLKDLDWLHEHYPLAIPQVFGFISLLDYESFLRWCVTKKIDFEDCINLGDCNLPCLKFLIGIDFDFTNAHITAYINDECKDLISKLYKPGFTPFPPMSVKEVRWYYRNGLLTKDDVREHFNAKHPSIVNWCLN